MLLLPRFSTFFFFNDTATTEIYTLSLHDALPIYLAAPNTERAEHLSIVRHSRFSVGQQVGQAAELGLAEDRKSTRLNSSHSQISYAVFCLKKKKKKTSEEPE